MATIDPRIQGIQTGGGPSLGGPPDTLSPLAAGSAAGHLASMFLAKRDTNAHNRGVEAASQHIVDSTARIENYKAKNILSPSFDLDFSREVTSVLTQAKEARQYEPSNETERLAYENTLNSYTRNMLHNSIVESIKAVKEHQVGVLNSNIEMYKDSFMSAPSDRAAQEVATQLFKSLYEASRTDLRNPGVITPEQAEMQFETHMKQAAIMRNMNFMSVQELFEFGNDPTAMVMIPKATQEEFSTGTPPGLSKLMPLDPKERQAIISYALEKQKNELHFMENIRKITDEKITVQKAGMGREFVDGVLATRGTMGPELLAKMQGAMRPDGAPLFDRAEVEHMSKFIEMTLENAKKPPTTSDPYVYAKYFRQIFPENKDGGLNYSAFPLPSPLTIMADPNLSQSHKDFFVGHIASEREHRTNRDFSEFDRKRSEGILLLKSALGGEAMIELSEDTKNFWGELQNAYVTRVSAAYDEAVKNGQGLRSINPQTIVNRLIEERLPAMEGIFFRDAMRQAKALSGYAGALSSKIPDDAPMSIIIDRLVDDIRAGHLTQEATRLLQLARTLDRRGKRIGDLRRAMQAGNELDVIRETPTQSSSGGTVQDRIKQRQGKK